jgi:hypothetical protein
VITHLLIPKARRKYLYLCFNYLKWVDDFVDNPSNAKHEKLEFTENQLKLLTDLSNREKVELKSNGEYFLYYFVEYANSVNNYDLIAEVRNSMESIKMDAERLNNNGIFSISELHQYFDKVVQPVFNLTYIFLLPTVKVHKDDKYIGRFVWKVLILRDFFEDYDSGYINISKEEIEKYKLDVSSLKKDINRIQWIKDKYPEYIKTLNEDILIFKSLPLKVKLFWSPIYPYMILEFLRIQMYDYNFGVKHKKNFKNELKVYSQSFSFNLKFLFKIFFRHLI